jgi:hypothetical protein
MLLCYTQTVAPRGSYSGKGIKEHTTINLGGGYDEGSNKEGEGSKGDGNSDKGGGQQRGQGRQGQLQQGWHAIKRGRATRAMVSATRVVGNKEADGAGDKSNGNGNEVGGQATVTRVVATATVSLLTSQSP